MQLEPSVMVDDQQKQGTPAGKKEPAELIREYIEKFKELPPKVQMIIVGVGVVVFYLLFLGGDKPQPRQAVRQAVPQSTASPAQPQGLQQTFAKKLTSNSSFGAVEAGREGLIAAFVKQQRVALSDIQEEMEGRLTEKEEELKGIEDAISNQTQQMQSMIEAFNEQMRSFEGSNSDYRNEITRIVQELQKQGVQGGGAGATFTNGRGSAGTAMGAQSRRKKRISQVPLSSGQGVNSSGQPLLSINGKKIGQSNAVAIKVPTPAPFLPPLGFVHGVMLNGVDALAGGGGAPALVRLSGAYKTAMNSTVSLDGCIAFVEFEGDVSTERAVGKPSRMTCVHPDMGVKTYSLSGYVVDAEDGIVGVPGVFFEGDASRIAAGMLAEFIAGSAEIIKENQFTEEAGGSEGDVATNLTGSAITAQFAAGIEGAIGSMKDYLNERTDRVVPFVRLDPTREISMVLLSGFELRDGGAPWTMLLDGDKLDGANKAREAAQAKAAQAAARK